MPHFIVIRHSITKPVAGSSSHTWQLTPEGREAALRLPDLLARYNPACIYTSGEPKTRHTGEIVASNLNIPSEAVSDLHETKRDTVPYFENIEDFRSAIRAAMDKPDELLFGEETFNEAYKRFDKRIQGLVAAHDGQSIAVVTGGTMLSIFLNGKTGQDMYSFWRSLGMPCYAVLSLPDYDLVDLVTEV